MKNITTQIILIFLFQFPSVSSSQTFKCEFGQERIKGGIRGVIPEKQKY
jgi:hypothetical protein